MALYFDQVSLASLPANLLAAPAIAPIMWLGSLAAAAAQLTPALAAPFTALSAPLLVYVRWVAHTTAGLPLAAIPGVAARGRRRGGGSGGDRGRADDPRERARAVAA